MIPLLIGAVAVAGACIGWMGYKANARIAAWGRKMNEVDDIFRMDEGTDDSESALVRGRPIEQSRAKPPFGAQHLPTGRATSR